MSVTSRPCSLPPLMCFLCKIHMVPPPILYRWMIGKGQMALLFPL